MPVWLSTRYYANRACRARVATDREISDREAMFHSDQAIRHHQLECLSRLLEHAGNHVAYDRDLFREHGFDHRTVTSGDVLKQLPVLDKKDIRFAWHCLLSEAVPARERHRNASGGSLEAPLHDVQRDADFDRAMFHKAMEKARIRLGSDARIEIDFVDHFEATPSGKHRCVVNEYPGSTQRSSG